VNIDELKHQLVQVWAELYHRHVDEVIQQWWRRLSACETCKKAERGIFWTKFAL